MSNAGRTALGTRDHGPVICVFELDTGNVIPVATPLDGGGAFDKALNRSGWTAVKVGYQVAAIADGADIRNPVILPQAWTMLPAAAEDLVLLSAYFGRSALPGERRTVMTVGMDGQVHRTAQLPWGFDTKVIGEIGAGVVTTDGIASWRGEAIPLPVDRAADPLTADIPIGVVAGRTIVFEGVDHVESVNTITGSRSRLLIPARPRRWTNDARWMLMNWHSASGAWLIASDEGGSIVAGPDGELRHLAGYGRHPGPSSNRLWCGDQLLLLQDGSQGAVEYDPVADNFRRVSLGPIDWSEDPAFRVDVTGRLASSSGRGD